MSLRETIGLSWKGKEHSLLLTTAVMVKVEQKAPNPVLVMDELSKGNPQLASIAAILSVLFAECGEDVSIDELYDEMFNAESQEEVIAMATTVLSAFIPKPKKKAPSTKKRAVKK